MSTIFANEQAIYGGLKSTGSKDPDVIYSAKQALLVITMPFNVISWIMIICGGGICLTIIGIPIGIILLAIAFFIRSRLARYKKAVEAAYTRYVGEGKAANANQQTGATTI